MSRRFLFVNPFGLGDVIFTLACVQRVRQTYPDSFIGFIGNERTLDLLHLAPAINEVYVFNRDAIRAAAQKSPWALWAQIKPLQSSIRKRSYDALIDFSLGREFSAAAFFLGIPKRVGFDYKGRGIFLTDKKAILSYSDTPVAQAQINLLLEKNVLPDNRMPSKIDIRITNVPLELKEGSRVLVVAPGGGKSWGRDARFKQWDPEKFAEVVNALGKSNPSMQVVLMGDYAERELLERVRALLLKAPDLFLAGEPISAVCGVLSKASLLLCNDGGLMHLAHALGTKTVAIFGPVDEKVYGPYGRDVSGRVMTHAVACRPCYQNFHFPRCQFDRQCLSGLSAHKVIEAVKEIL